MKALLSAVSVLDFSIWRPGPYATSLLAGLGADVLKVEPPGGDPMRQYPELFESVNLGKRSIVLDLKDPTDRGRALALSSEADVVVEGFRPGVMARLGLDEPVVRAGNPGVVYCSLSGYGQHGDLSRLPGHDVNYQAWAGALAPEGQTATMPPLPVADLASGLAAAFGICAALLGRGSGGAGAGDSSVTNVGSYLDVSMTDVLATWTGTAKVASATEGSRGSAVAGYGLFATEDGRQVALGVVSEQHFWSALCTELGLHDLSEIGFEERTRRGVELNDAVAGAVARHRRDELVQSLVKAGVPVAPVLDRAGMAARAPFRPFPIRFDPDAADDADAAGDAAVAGASKAAPALDQHRGQGFG